MTTTQHITHMLKSEHNINGNIVANPNAGDKPKRVILKPHAMQPGFGSIPSRMLYNVVGGDYTFGSTVTIETMAENGFEVEVV
jgi:hypothetical protein